MLDVVTVCCEVETRHTFYTNTNVHSISYATSGHSNITHSTAVAHFINEHVSLTAIIMKNSTTRVWRIMVVVAVGRLHPL